MMKIIALTGPKGSGKDTVAEIIKHKYGTFYNVKSIAFADPLKVVIQGLFNLETKEQYDLFKRADVSYQLPGHLTEQVEGRRLVREIGMMMRQYDDKQFTQYVWKEIAADPNALWVVTDLRFDNEYMMLKQLGAKIVKITRPQYEYDGHITERAFDDHLVDKILHNDGDLEYLNIRTDVVMTSILKEWR
jgi:hypothetical protein